MQVICKGYKTCEDQNICFHAKIHELDSWDLHLPCATSHNMHECIAKCECSPVYLRKKKIEKLNEL